MESKPIESKAKSMTPDALESEASKLPTAFRPLQLNTEQLNLFCIQQPS